MRLGLHVIQFPNGRFGYVGNLPIGLAQMQPATKSDVLGGRFMRTDAGDLVSPRWPSFETEAEARRYAEDRLYSVEP